VAQVVAPDAPDTEKSQTLLVQDEMAAGTMQSSPVVALVLPQATMPQQDQQFLNVYVPLYSSNY